MVFYVYVLIYEILYLHIYLSLVLNNSLHKYYYFGVNIRLFIALYGFASYRSCVVR
jgi:hypothetical protein